MRYLSICIVLLVASAAPALAEPLKFDMGTEKSFVFDGFRQVTGKTVYSRERGYGWVKKAPRGGARDIPEPLGCDFILGPGSFRVDVPKGKHHVWVLLGDSGHGINHPRFWHTPYWIRANGREVVSVKQTVEQYYYDYYFSNLYSDYTPGESLWEKYFAKYDRPHTFFVDAPDGHVQLDFSGDVPVNAVAMHPQAEAPAATRMIEALREARKEQFDSAWHMLAPDETPAAREPTAAERQRGYVLFHRPAVQAVYPHTRPEPDEAFAGLAAFATPGEYEPMTFSVWPLNDLKNVTVSIGPLKNDKGDTLPAEALTLACVKYIEVRGRRDAYTVRPRTLLPCKQMALYRGVTKRYWVTVHVPQDQASGEYRGEIRIQAKGGTATIIPATFEVLPFGLVKDAGIAYGFYYYTPDSTTYRGHGSAGASGRSAWAQAQALGLAEADFRDQVAHGMNCAAVSPQWSMFRIENDRVAIREENWQRHDRFMNIYVNAGMTRPLPAYSIGNILSLGIPDRVTAGEWETGQKFSKRFQQLYGDVIRVFYERARAAQAAGRWPEVIFYASDELSNYRNPGADWGRAHLELLNRIKKTVPRGFRACASINGQAERVMLPVLDVAIPNNGFPINAQTLDMIRANGCELWMYNIGTHRFTWGFFLVKAGVKGRLQWHYRSGLRGTCDPNNWLTSSTYAMVDTTPDGVLPTRDWENVREGVDDARYVRTLEQWIARAKKTGEPAARRAADRAQRTLDWILNRTQVRLDYYTAEVGYWDPPVFDKLRRRIAAEIVNVREAMQ